MALFRYVTRLGSFEADEFPSSGVYELTLLRDIIRFSKENIRSHESHPIHEKAMINLPSDLVVLRMDNTKVRTFPTVPVTLEELYAEYNYFLRIPDLAYATHLQVMNLGDGRIEGFDGALPPRLHTLDLRNNALQKDIHNLIQGRDVNLQIGGNPLRQLGMKAQRGAGGVTYQDYGRHFGQREPIAEQAKVADKNIYKNTQNVHDGGVQNSTQKNINYLLNRRHGQPHSSRYLDRINQTLLEFAKRHTKDNKAKGLLQCFKKAITTNLTNDANEIHILRDFIKTPYAMHGTTFDNLLEAVWLRIESEDDSERRDQLIQRFCEEIRDGKDRCTGGMMVRLCNIFIGFDENIEIELRPNDILQSRIPATLTRIRKEMKLHEEAVPPFSYWVKCIQETEKDFMDVKLEEDKWQNWLYPLYEPIFEDLHKMIVNAYGKDWFTFDRQTVNIEGIFKESGVNFYPWIQSEMRALDAAPSAPPID